MLEVVFNDSAKGAITIAKKYSKEELFFDSNISAENEETQAQFEGKALGGSPADVACIGFNLDVGDITGAIDGNERKHTFIKLFSSIDFEESEIEEFFKYQRDDFEKLVNAAKNGIPIRVWKSNTAVSACGYAYLCNILRDLHCK